VQCVTAHSDNEQTDFVLVDRPRPNVAQVTLNRPERMNSMAFDVMVPLKKVLDELTYDNSVRVIVLTGAGRGFSSGADHKSAGSVPNVDGLTRPTYALRSMQVLDDVILGLRRMHQPVIAAVNGAAIGGGLCLALACDIRVAASGAYFRAAGINNGLTASELGLSYLLPRAIGSSRAFELMLTGRDVDAQEARTRWPGVAGRARGGPARGVLPDGRGHRGVLPAGNRVDQAHTVDWNGRR
jgi:enoyl-CoA hydratase